MDGSTFNDTIQEEVASSISEDEYESLIAQRVAVLEEECSSSLPQGFYFSQGNLMFQSEAKQRGATGPFIKPSPLFICSKLLITAYVRDDVNEGHGQLLEFDDVDGCRHEWPMPMSLLAGEGVEYRGALLDKGLRIAPGRAARDLLTKYIQLSKSEISVRCVSHPGWHKGSFVFPDKVLGCNEKERIILQTGHSIASVCGVKGTVPEWREQIGSLCVGNSRLVFGVSAAFAPPLLNLLGLENGGIHFEGESSKGKTTVLHAACSVWGGEDYLQRWRSTVNGLEALAVDYSDRLLCLDELSQIEAEEAGMAAYMLFNGSGKNRSNCLGTSKKKSTWRILFLSTGEINLARHMEEVGKKVRGGQKVRLVDIPADICKHGVFDDLHGYTSGSVFADEIKTRCHAFYGVPSREFIQKLIEQKESSLAHIKNMMKEFVDAVVPLNSDGQIYRVAKHFALVAASGELASMFGVTGWAPGESIRAVNKCFLDWLESRGGIESQEEGSVLSQVRKFFCLHGSSRFSDWKDPHDYRTHNRVGFRKGDTLGDQEYFVFPEVFNDEISKGFDPKRVAKICIKYGLLFPGSKGESYRSERLPGRTKNARCYRFTSKVLGEDEPVSKT